MGFALFVCPDNHSRGEHQPGQTHKTVGMWARQMVKLVRRWFPTLPITLLGDTAYSILELGVDCQKQQVTLITPFRLDSAIHEVPSERDVHTIGRPRVVGSRLPSLDNEKRLLVYSA
jgi:hypothetical protein